MRTLQYRLKCNTLPTFKMNLFRGLICLQLKEPYMFIAVKRFTNAFGHPVMFTIPTKNLLVTLHLFIR